MTDIITSTAAELADALARKELSAVEVTQAHLDRIAAVDGDVHAFLHVDAEGALAAARDIDERRAGGAVETQRPQRRQVGLIAHRLFEVDFAPMLSPAMAAAHGPFTDPAQIMPLPWVSPRDPTWDLWLAAAGIERNCEPCAARTALELNVQLHEARAAMAGSVAKAIRGSRRMGRPSGYVASNITNPAAGASVIADR